MKNIFITVVAVFMLIGVALPQQVGLPQQNVVLPTEFSTNGPSTGPTSFGGEDYRIGPDDLIEITVYGFQGLNNNNVRVTAKGMISYQPAGDIPVMGFTQQEVARAIEEKLKGTGIRNPRVQVLVREYSSQPVSIVGAVRNANIYQIKGHKTLIDMLAMAGDRTENAGGKIQVLRGDATIVIDMVDLYQKGDSQLNIPIYAGDRIVVLEAQTITVVGEVEHQGQFPLKYGRNLTVMEAWALGGGPTPNAKKKETVILREHEDGRIQEIPVNMDKLLARQIEDMTMMPGDVLYVPSSAMRSSVRRVLDSLISVGVGRAIYVR